MQLLPGVNRMSKGILARARRFVCIWLAVVTAVAGSTSGGYTSAMMDRDALLPPPALIRRMPDVGERLAPDGVLELEFDRGMDPNVGESLSFRPALKGAVTWPNVRTLRFTPAQDLPRATEFVAALSAGARAADGGELDAPLKVRFVTQGWLEVGQTIPAAGAQDIAPDATITVLFNRPVVSLTLLAEQKKLPNPLRFEPPIAGTVEWLNTSVLVFRPSAPLPGGVEFTGIVSEDLRDVEGAPLRTEFRWKFSTVLPKVISASPDADGERRVRIDAPIVIRFDQSIDPKTAIAAFSLKAGSKKIAGRIVVQGNELTFTPAQRLDFDTAYSARVAPGVTSLAGGRPMKQAFAWTFRTVPLLKLLKIEPADGATNVPPDAALRLYFNTDIDPNTVMAHLRVTPPMSPALVFTYYNEYDHTFTVNFDVQPSTRYTVQVEPGILDPYGNRTQTGLQSSFTVGEREPWMRPYLRGGVSMFDARRPVRVAVDSINIADLDVDLYRLGDTPADLPLSEMYFESLPASAQLVRSIRQPVNGRRNESTRTLIQLGEDSRDGRLSSGMYIALLRSPQYPIRNRIGAFVSVLYVSDLNLVMKSEPDEVLLWATDLGTGEPIADLDLEVYQRAANVVQTFGSARTNADGVARVARTLQSPEYIYDTFALARGDRFAAVSSSWDAGLASFGLPVDYGYAQQLRSHLYTDRAIYRAGQKIFWRGVVRTQDDFRYDLPGGLKIQVRLLDGKYDVVSTQDVVLDAFGTFSGELTLAADTALGDYRLEARIDDANGVNFGNASAALLIAAYRPPEFEVTVMPEQAQILRDGTLLATIEAAYLSGSALRDAEISWNVIARRHDFAPPQLERYSFRDDDDPWLCFSCWWFDRNVSSPAPIASGSGRTDANGRFALDLALPAEIRDENGALISGPIALSVEANVTGADAQVLSGRSTVIAHPAESYVGVAMSTRIAVAGKQLRGDFVTVDWLGRRVAGMPVRITVVRREWENRLVEESDGSRWEYTQVDRDPVTYEVTTDEVGAAQYEFSVPQGGTYKLTAEMRDASDRVMRASTFFWATGPGARRWRRENNESFDLLADRSTYEQGETARILIPSPFIDASHPAHYALVTIERGHILKHEVVRITSDATLYEFPIEDAYAPNIFVSVVLMNAPGEGIPEQRLGVIGLRVTPRKQTMRVTLTPDRERAQPGETVAFTLRAADAVGAPISGSFSVDLVDKGVLNLQPREADAIVNAFFGPAGLRVRTASSLSVSADRAPEQGDLMEPRMAMQVADAMPAAAAPEGRGGGGEAPAAPSVRENFADTAFWRADVTTDDTGEARFSVKLPDNLTTWVMRAVGIDARTRVGEGLVNVVAAKPLMVRPITPRFLVVDDVVVLGAIVQNATVQTMTAQVVLQSSGVALAGSAEQTATVAADSEVLITWTVRALDAPQADLVFSVSGGGYSDAAKPRLATAPSGGLRIERYSTPETMGTAGELSGEESRSEIVVLPKDADAVRSRLDVQLNASLASALREGLTYVEGYPYECVEQIVSRFVPNVLTLRALTQLGIEDTELAEKMPGLVEDAVTRLVAFQNEDGGWGWWARRESSPNVSAWAVYGLLQARDAGFDVPNAMISRGLDYLQRVQSSISARDSEWYLSWQAWLQYVLAEGGRDDAARTKALFAQRASLSNYGRALLILAMGRRDPQDARIQTLFADLNSKAILSATGAHWEEEGVDWWAMNTDTRTTALVLAALARFDAKNALAPNVVRWLMQARTAGSGYWRSTHETAWSLIALTDWMRSTGELAANYEYSLRLGDEQLATGVMSATNLMSATVVTVPGTQLVGDGAARVTLLKRAGEGKLYYTAHLKAMLPVPSVRAVDRGIVVQRRYVRADCVAGVRCPSVRVAKVGDVLRVEITIIAPNELHYVQLEDPLPAGAEAIDAVLATSSQLDQGVALGRSDAGRPWWWYWGWWSRSELRDDRVALFADWLGPGAYTYSYTMRVTSAGEFNVRPTYAALQYFPEVFGRGEGMLLKIDGRPPTADGR